MIAIQIGREPRSIDPLQLHGFRIAGQDVVLDVALPELASFAAAIPADFRMPVATERDAGAGHRGSEVFRGPSWLAGSDREVVCRITPAGYELAVAGIGDFFVARSGMHVLRTSGNLEPSEPAIAETVLGPALILALALQGTFCLHASAVSSPAGAVVFLGPSGAGKSTLAAYLGNETADFTPLADDITPFMVAASGPEAYPHFPQLKLPTDHQPARNASARSPLLAAYVLDLPAPGAAEDASNERLDPVHGIATLMRHTVAIRLFGRSLTECYLSRMGAAWSGRVRRLRFPRRFEVLPAVAAAIAAELAGGHPSLQRPEPVPRIQVR